MTGLSFIMFLKMSRRSLGSKLSCRLFSPADCHRAFSRNALLVSTVRKQSQVGSCSAKYVSVSSRVSLSVPDVKNKTDWRRSVGVVMVAEVAVGCGLDLPGSSGAVGRGGQFILSGEAQGGSGEARCHARRREGWPDVTSRTVCGRGVWFGARLGLGRRGACGFNCC